MTIDECLALPNRTEVHLADGRRGRIVVWHKATGAVGIAVDGALAPVHVSCLDLYVDGDGRIRVQASRW